MSGFSSLQSAWGRVETTLHVKGERGMFEHLYNVKVRRDRKSGETLLTADPAAHTVTATRLVMEGVVAMVCAVCGETFGMVNARAYLRDLHDGVRYTCKAHRGKA